MGKNIKISPLEHTVSSNNIKLNRLRYLESNLDERKRRHEIFRIGGFTTKSTKFDEFMGVIYKDVYLIDCEVKGHVNIFDGEFHNCVFNNGVIIYNSNKNKGNLDKKYRVIIKDRIFKENETVDLNPELKEK